jgi:hypothetical protein
MSVWVSVLNSTWMPQKCKKIRNFKKEKGRWVLHYNKKYSSGASHYYRVEWYNVIRSLDDGAATIWNPKYLLFETLNIYYLEP